MDAGGGVKTVSGQEALRALREHLERQVIGQEGLIRSLLVALLADGHLLVEGAPGLAKTRAVRALAASLEGDFHRIQFTPDLLPSDLVGTEVYRPEEGSFRFRPGPVFHNLVLADEVNRAPAKVQSALLEAMAERQVTVGQETHPLPRLFLVMATQNPIEQEGTYPLPEAQLDRFLMKVRIDYPGAGAEAEILRLARGEALAALAAPGDATALLPPPVVTQETLFAARRQVLEVHLAPALESYPVRLVLATRDPSPFGSELAGWVRYGASPRATIALDRCARAHAWLSGRDYVTPGDFHAVAFEVLRHRLILTYEAEAEGVTADRFVAELLARVAVP
ncbi:MAG: MoxR family ATPase [Magnetococcales bacterium]|nr:MoxR family ATPase [Magnetococcales bacterium]MBF0156269.1 MoxR family ATPase [Magnetococcales bacterium]